MDKKKFNFEFKRLIFNDKYLIITSILLAVLIWIITSLNIGTAENKTIKITVPIKLGDEVSEQLGMQYYTLQDTIDLSVTITGAKYVIGQVEDGDLNVRFDTSNVNRTGEQSIPILVSKGSSNLDFTISATYPTTVEAYFDVNETKGFNIDLDYNSNAVAKGYTFGEPVLNTEKVFISGPKTYVDKIERAFISVKFPSGTKLTEPYSTKRDIEIEGNGVETSYLQYYTRSDLKSELENVTVTFPVLKTVELPVKVNFEDMPSGFDENKLSVTYSSNTIEAGVLESTTIQTAVIGTISFSELHTGNNSFTFDITDLDGISVINSDLEEITVNVYIPSNYTAKVVSLATSDITVSGVDSDSTASLSNLSSRSVTVYVPAESKDKQITLEAKCTVEDNESGTYPVTIKAKGDTSAWVYGEYTVYVDIE